MLPFLWHPSADESVTCVQMCYLLLQSQTGRPASVDQYVGTIRGITMFISVKQI